MRILFVDDSDMMRAAFQRVASRLDAEVVVAASGLEALEVLKTSHFDLVVSDVSMPEMDGVELLETLQRERADIVPKFVFHTSEPDRVARLGCPVIPKGVQDYLKRLRSVMQPS